MRRGLYIAFEGMTGVGKSVQSKLLFEPGGSEIASAIRNVVQRTKFSERMDPVCKAYKTVRRGYEEVARKYRKIVRIVDGNGSKDEVEKRVWDIIWPWLKNLSS